MQPRPSFPRPRFPRPASNSRLLLHLRSASAAVNPTVDAISSTGASRIPFTEPNFLSSAFFRFGPMPGIVSSADWIAAFCAHACGGT